jgi:NAD(P)-dependent dehydrogenase (short-subunit alcohol dehydrogenase family)
MSLANQYILITGAARRIGRALALRLAREGATIIIHHGHSSAEAEKVLAEIKSFGGKAHIVQGDLNDPDQTVQIIETAFAFGPLSALVNNAAIFEPLNWDQTDLAAWNRHLAINLTAPFLLSQSFARYILPSKSGRIVNLLDWRVSRPPADHFPYTISKTALAALTHSLAIALAPHIQVNGIALGAILPPSLGNSPPGLLENVPAQRWADMTEVEDTLLFLLAGPSYITGEIIHLDGGRHLV